MKRVYGWCLFGVKCRNPKCNYIHSGHTGAKKRPSCTTPEPVQVRRDARDPRTCKYRDSCNYGVCFYNHPERSFCSVEQDCFQPECPSNHQVLLCRNGLLGGQCINTFCEFRHIGKNEAPSQGPNEEKNSEADLSRQKNPSWNGTDAQPMVRLVDFWIPQIPNWVLSLLYDQILIPKCKQALEEWGLADSISFRSWSVPWLLPLMRVFSQESMETFLVENIVPKLHQAMRQLVINPLYQVLEPWDRVMVWVDIVPLKSIVDILETVFFPKWLEFLAAWLNQLHDINNEDIYRWYLWWLGLLNKKLLQDTKVRDNLQKGLEMIGNVEHSTPVNLSTCKAFRALKVTLLQNYGDLFDIKSDP